MPLQFSDVQAAQQGMSRDQLAATAQAATLPANSNPTFTAPSISPVTSSTPYRSQVDNLGNNISGLQGNSSSLQQLLDLFNSSNKTDTPKTDITSTNTNNLYQSRIDVLDQQRKDELSQLESNYGAEKTNIEQNQTNELDPLQKKLSYIGGAEVGPNAYLADQLNQQITKIKTNYSNQLNTLFQQHETFRQQANSAYADKDFSLAEAMAQNASDSQNQIYQKQKDYASLFMQVYNQEQQDQQSQFQKDQAQQKYLSDNGINAPFYQLPGSPTVYDGKTGQPLTYAQYQAAGGAGKPGAAFPDVQLVQQSADYGPQYKEWQGYQAQGGTLSYPEYQNMDANRKRSVTNLSYNQQLSENQKTDINNLINKWKGGYVQGNGTISSKDYKIAKEQFIQAYGASAAKDFDSAMAIYVDTKNPDYQGQYGIN